MQQRGATSKRLHCADLMGCKNCAASLTKAAQFPAGKHFLLEFGEDEE